MTRALAVVDTADAAAVDLALARALTGDGPALISSAGQPRDLPATVEQRVAVVVETSGSTGRPKRVALSADALLASAAASEGALGGPGQWLLALPLNYIAGLNVLVRSRAAGTEPVLMEGEGFDVDRFLAAAHAMHHPVRYTSLVPAQLARLVESDAALDALRRFDRILVGGQAAPVELMATALELGLNVTRTYGSSETAGGCVYDGLPIGTTQVRIADGRVELSGPTLAEGYLDDPGRTAFAFREQDGRRWYRTDDAGELVDGVLRVTGRLDDVIVSGGLKVSLAEVELAVRVLPGFGDAVVVATPHAEWGEVPVVFSTGTMPLDELRRVVVERLGRAAAPDRILHLDRIPLTATGKPDRVLLATLALK